ncbi:hypothetical protein CANCADRAFT_2181 [Tortispora caseinolytica NRRL Y-17796]|uniref:G10 protein n=1 Tax=Tortispora caseinolytica NRRL Y-17796 TaxID=767744 RepID=A0A1E4TF96_9ASCO|nr:hypothetical protein CANCADRAFT_2181 [Tortispora caseinolytica NRRL Y-17796]
MTKSARKSRRPPPKGYDEVKPTLDAFAERIEELSGVSSEETTWKMFQLLHQRSRYIYEMYYRKHAISKELYDWLLKARLGDPLLIAKWKKQGYENLCCLRCIDTGSIGGKTTCICRVPKGSMTATDDDVKTIRCRPCGCRGCASGD